MKITLFILFCWASFSLSAQSSAYDKTPLATTHKTRATTKATALSIEVAKEKQETDSLPVEHVDEKNVARQLNKISLRNDYPYVKKASQSLEAKDILSYPDVREEDIAYRIRLWNDIDMRQKENRYLMYVKGEYGATENLIDIVMEAIKNKKLTVFSSEDDRFTTPLTPEQAYEQMGEGIDTVAVYDEEGNIEKYQARKRMIETDSVYTYRLKEDWFYNKAYGRMMVRIVGIAPIVAYRLSTGEIQPNSEHPAFWIYYNDLKPILSKYQTTHPIHTGMPMYLNEALDKHLYKGNIFKSDYENPGEIPWIYLYPEPEERDEMKRKIEQKIYHYEAQLWPAVPEMTEEDVKHQKKKKRKQS